MITTTLRIPEKVLQSLKLISLKEKTSINKIMNGLLIEYLEDYLDSKDADEALAEMEGKSWVELDSLLAEL
ncbi:MAG: hypothetical protein ISR89_09055 [Candidatus Marinimicrobia bacterium]|nr:hypothetical protein [Candidatus Neomarinimicrobiota bacterium]MBL7031301.1 hypothetical protein [Candidatus Neomarinimicrobiota bacterium]